MLYITFKDGTYTFVKLTRRDKEFEIWRYLTNIPPKDLLKRFKLHNSDDKELMSFRLDVCASCCIYNYEKVNEEAYWLISTLYGVENLEQEHNIKSFLNLVPNNLIDTSDKLFDTTIKRVMALNRSTRTFIATFAATYIKERGLKNGC